MQLMRIYVSKPNESATFKTEIATEKDGEDGIKFLVDKSVNSILELVERNYGKSGEYFIESNTGGSEGIVNHDEGIYRVDLEEKAVKESGCRFCRGANYLISLSKNRIAVEVVFGITNNNLQELAESGHITAKTDIVVNYCFSCGRKVTG